MKIKYIGTALFFEGIVLPLDVLNKILNKKDCDDIMSSDAPIFDKDRFRAYMANRQAKIANSPGRTPQEKYWAYCTQEKLHWRRRISADDWNKQKSVPVKLDISIAALVPGIAELKLDISIAASVSYWLFQDSIVSISDENLYQTEDIKNHIKLFIYKRGDKFAKVSREVERFEKFEKIKPIQREQLPEDVRMFVWRRDKGKCVTCGSDRYLEFDHIIPVSKGGSNTERNIQLLCADCNKKKSSKI